MPAHATPDFHPETMQAGIEPPSHQRRLSRGHQHQGQHRAGRGGVIVVLTAWRLKLPPMPLHVPISMRGGVAHKPHPSKCLGAIFWKTRQPPPAGLYGDSGHEHEAHDAQHARRELTRLCGLRSTSGSVPFTQAFPGVDSALWGAVGAVKPAVVSASLLAGDWPAFAWCACSSLGAAGWPFGCRAGFAFNQCRHFQQRQT